MGPLVVPMNPEFLPEFSLLIAGIFLGVSAIHLLLTRQRSRALKSGLAGVACIVVAFVMASTLHRPATPPGLKPAAHDSMSLVLGNVVLRVAPSDQYRLSVDGKPFLELDLRRSGLALSGIIGSHGHVASEIRRNTFPFRRNGIRPAKPDSHTLLVQEEGKDIFRMHYSEPRLVELKGQFFARRSAERALISFQEGIRWNGGRVPPATVVDLRGMGKGTIDFSGSGLIRILPQS